MKEIVKGRYGSAIRGTKNSAETKNEERCKLEIVCWKITQIQEFFCQFLILIYKQHIRTKEDIFFFFIKKDNLTFLKRP